MRMSRRMGLLGGKKQPPTLAKLFADMTVVTQAGRESYMPGTVKISLSNVEANPSIYVFAFCKNRFAIHHLLSNGSEYGKTTLYRATDDSNATDIYISGTSCYLSEDGRSSFIVCGGTIIAATFPSYTDDQISAVFGNISVKNSAGNNSSTSRAEGLKKSNIAGEIILTAYNGAMCAATIASPTEYICTLDNGSTMVRNFVDAEYINLSYDGTKANKVYGGTMLTI